MWLAYVFHRSWGWNMVAELGWQQTAWDLEAEHVPPTYPGRCRTFTSGYLLPMLWVLLYHGV